jgi:hypothetical protein
MPESRRWVKTASVAKCKALHLGLPNFVFIIIETTQYWFSKFQRVLAYNSLYTGFEILEVVLFLFSTPGRCPPGCQKMLEE